MPQVNKTEAPPDALHLSDGSEFSSYRNFDDAFHDNGIRK